MNACLKTSLVTLSILVAACSAQPGDMDADESSQSSDALGRVPVDPGDGTVIVHGPMGPGGPTTPPAGPRTAPRVMSRSALGTTVSLTMDRPLAADEIALSGVQVLVVRESGTSFTKTNLATGAFLSPDKKTLHVTLSEPVKAGEIYFPRAEWHPCAGSTSGQQCAPRPAHFGELVVRSSRTSALADALAAATTHDLGLMFAPAPSAAPSVAQLAPSDHTAVMLADAPLPAQGTFHVKSVTPADQSMDVSRQTDRVIVTFEGGTIDCAQTGVGKSAFHLHSTSPDVFDQQSMYTDPQNPLPTSGGYRGSLRCDQDENRLVFTTPGVLLGDSWFQIDLNVASVEGNFMSNKVLEFKTQRPGLQVLADRVENDYGGDNTCDDDWFGSNYCDIYVTTAIATAGGGQPSRIPEQGDFSGMTYYPQDNSGGTRWLQPSRVLYANANPIDEVVDMQLWALDADNTTAWKKIFETAGKIAGNMATALTAYDPEYGAIAEGVSAGFLGIGEAIPTDGDDFLGSGRFIFTAHTQRWGTMATSPIVLELSKNAPNRGPVKVYLHTEELPKSWQLPGIIL